MMANGVEFDAVDGVQDSSGQVYVWDGYHRGEAARSLDRPLLVNLQPGTRSDAEWLALAANQKHGLRRSRADKQYIIRKALQHPNGASLSDREIARHCGVDHKTVGKIRGAMELSGEIPQIQKRTVTRQGTTYQQDTHSIGSVQQWMPVWQLEQALRSWLNDTFSNKETQVQVLEAICQKTPEGQMYLTRLLTNNILPSPRRKRDVIQTCHNLLEQHRQSGNHEPEEVSQEHQEKSGNDMYTSPGTHTSIPHPLLSCQLVRQEFECPRCGQEKIVGVNGSKRWCLGCEAQWATANEFLAEFHQKQENLDQHEGGLPLPSQQSASGNLTPVPATAKSPRTSTVEYSEVVTRHRIQRRFLGILARLEEQDEQLVQIDAWLDDLEHKLVFAEENGTVTDPFELVGWPMSVQILERP